MWIRRSAGTGLTDSGFKLKNNVPIRGTARWLWVFLIVPCAWTQDPNAANPVASSTASATPDPSTSEKWSLFVSETVTPMTLVEAVPQATATQLGRFSPLYGRHFWRREAFLKRLGATVGDEVSRNFFADFLLASAFHEDTRYVRKGSSHGRWSRIGYAISRAVVTRTDSADPTFNWANVIGCAMSAGLSNAYYPPVSRKVSITAVNWGSNIAGSGLSNLMPELGPDVGHWIKRHLTGHP